MNAPAFLQGMCPFQFYIWKGRIVGIQYDIPVFFLNNDFGWKDSCKICLDFFLFNRYNPNIRVKILGIFKLLLMQNVGTPVKVE